MEQNTTVILNMIVLMPNNFRVILYTLYLGFYHCYVIGTSLIHEVNKAFC